MAQRVQLQFRETNATLPDTYQLPADLDLELASVQARIDGATASATFIPTLAILSQDGKLMARVRIDQEFAVGDTGDCTWAPFLKRQAAAAAAFTDMPGFHAHLTHNVTVPTGNNQRLEWDTWTRDGGTTYFQDGALSAGRLTEVRLMLAGWYARMCWATWSAEPASGFAGIAAIEDDTDIAESRKVQGVTYPVNMSSAPAIVFQDVRFWPADFTETQTFAFVNNVEFWIVQNSGVNRTCNEAYANIVYLGERLP